MKSATTHIALETKDLTIGYRQKRQEKIIASELNLQIPQGKLVALLGKNGIGKSTFLRTISKVQEPLRGHIYLHQKELSTYSHLELSKTLSLVLTERLPVSQLTVFELIALGRQPYTNWIDKLTPEDIEKVHWAMEQTEVSPLQHNYFYELSDGQLQRVLIARALAQDTEVIMLDEPTAHLDIHHTFKVFSLLKKLVATTHKTILISTHEVNLAIQLSDELILLSENDYFTGTPKDLIQQNAFEALFPKDLITFNKTLEQFVIKKN